MSLPIPSVNGWISSSGQNDTCITRRSSEAILDVMAKSHSNSRRWWRTIDDFQRTSSNCRKLSGLITCGSVRARVSATLKIDMREWFFSTAFRPGSFWKRFLRKWVLVYGVFLEKIVLSKWCFVLWQTGREKVLTWWRILFMRTKMLQCDPGQCRSLSHKHAFHVGACEKTPLYVMHAVGVYSVYTSRRIVGTTFRQS